MSELIAQIQDALNGWGDRPVLVEVDGSGETRSVSAADLWGEITERSRELHHYGVGKDSKVALFLDNSIDTVVLIFALLRIGAVPVFAKQEYRRTELTTIFRDIDPDVIVIDANYRSIVTPFLRDQGVIARGASGLHMVVPPTRDVSDPGLSEEIASINCTYRGEGVLIGSMTTEYQYLHGARVLQDGLQASPGESMLYPIPLSHIFTLVGALIVPILYGVTGVMARTIHPRVLVTAINRFRIDHITAVPEVYRLLLRSAGGKSDLPSLKRFVSGGSMLNLPEWEALEDAFGVEVLHGYGLTEFTPVSRNVHGSPRGGTVGPVCDGITAEIHNPDADGRGEIRIRGRGLSKGYYNNPGITKNAFRDGWFYTGDCGHFDGDHLVFDHEIKMTRKINGVILDLQEVRAAVLAATTADDADVFVEGNSVTALLNLSESADIGTEEERLRQVLKHQLAGYKVPRRIERRP